ncbi:MAG: hypothetical protein IJW30_04005 [Clostridia bacterium]|nr:hypothetical protein [Clostridia bacterium]
MDETTATPSPLSEALNRLLANPELLRTVGAMLGTPPTPSGDAAASTAPAETVAASATPATDGLSAVLSDPALMAKLPQMMETLAPMLQLIPASAPVHKDGGSHHCRDDLLLALKPFLSHERAAAVDTILRLSRLGSALQTLK